MDSALSRRPRRADLRFDSGRSGQRRLEGECGLPKARSACPETVRACRLEGECGLPKARSACPETVRACRLEGECGLPKARSACPETVRACPRRTIFQSPPSIRYGPYLRVGKERVRFAEAKKRLS